MKKTLMIAAFAMVAAAVEAQSSSVTSEVSDETTSKYSVETNSFWSNWFISAGATYNAFYTAQEKGLNDKPKLFSGARSTLGASVAVGKWFTPGFGLRTKLTGIWGRYVTPDAAGSLKNKSHNSYKYWTAQEQLLFNVSNLLLGYNENRVYNFIPYVGFGVTRNISANDYAHGWSAGLLNTFKVSPRVAVNLELGMNLSDDRIFDAAQTTHSDYGKSIAGMDRNFSVEVGITYSLGMAGWKKSPDVAAIKALSQHEIDALNQQLRDAEESKKKLELRKNSDIASLQQALADCQAAASAAQTAQPTAAVAEDKASTLQPTVLFRLGKSTIDASQYDSIRRVADYMNNHPDAKVVIRGYASPEGNAELNQALSVARAESVRKALVTRYKIAADRLTAEGFGATDSLFDDVEFNRIVTFSCLSK